ncbi:MAG TPA: TIGR03617 family F420-dependent LLM class oxidoreductase [Mycobacteriales bacterium]|nr:TIGR03617 family F420-dependent LLM class oxidoreductase [Mycobacteriales bacterium]
MLIDVRLDADLPDVPRAVAQLEEAGVGGVFTYEGPNDPFLPLGVAAVSSRSLALYSNLAVALPRSPMHLAYLAQDLQRASGGRFSLGLGTQVRAHVTRRFGGTWESPVEQLREWVRAVRAIQRSWATGEPLDFVGRWTQHTYCPPLFVPPPAPAAPILLGALGPRMTAMAVEEADGLLVHPFNTVASVAAMLADVPAAFPVVGQAVVAVTHDEAQLAEARTAVRGLVGFYASTPAYRRVLDVHGWGELQEELRALTRAGRWAELPAAVPDEVLDAVALVGTAEDVAAGLRTRFGRCDRVALSTPYPVPTEDLAALAALLA